MKKTKTKMKMKIIQEIKNYVFNFLSYREYSKYELEQRLKKKGYEINNIYSVLDRLESLNYINDERFAEKWIKDRLNLKPRGKNLIRKELKEKGINKKIIDKLINIYISENVERKMALKLAKKWLEKKEYKKNIDKIKLQRYLYGKGFNRYIIYNVMDILSDKYNFQNSDY